MVKTKFKQLSAIFLTLIMLFTVSATSIVYAYYDNDRDYQFKITSQQAVTRWSEREFRNTNNNNNAWKVRLDVSGEGDNTVTQFQIALADKTGASSWVNVTQGAKAKYSKSNDAGKHVYVYLQGRNNSKTANSYTITGIWDEETGYELS